VGDFAGGRVLAVEASHVQVVIFGLEEGV